MIFPIDAGIIWMRKLIETFQYKSLRNLVKTEGLGADVFREFKMKFKVLKIK